MILRQYWREEHQTIKSILNYLQALLAAMASSKKGKKNKPFSDAVMLSVMGPGHGQGRGHSKMDNIILRKKTIHNSMTEKQKGHTINMGLIDQPSSVFV